MLNGLYSAAAGMIAQQTRIDALSNDIANVNTTGYKQVRTGFRDLVYNIEAGMRIGAGAAVVDAGRLFSQGGLQQNGDPLSVALDGPGFFQVKRGDGSLALTRSGDFHADANGQLVTSQGDRMWPPVTLPAGTNVDDIAVSSAGVVSVKQTVVGTIHVFSVPSPSNLLPVGGSLFLPTTASGGARQMPTQSIRQGFLEASNVDLASAMVNVIDAQRSFQMDSKAIQTQDQLMQIANEIRR
jgi:flagellar basal-body rod protein FlgG